MYMKDTETDAYAWHGRSLIMLAYSNAYSVALGAPRRFRPGVSKKRFLMPGR